MSSERSFLYYLVLVIIIPFIFILVFATLYPIPRVQITEWTVPDELVVGKSYYTSITLKTRSADVNTDIKFIVPSEIRLFSDLPNLEKTNDGYVLPLGILKADTTYSYRIDIIGDLPPGATHATRKISAIVMVDNKIEETKDKTITIKR